MKKITVHIPELLLKQARKSTGQGITETVKTGLRLVAASNAFEEIRKLRGKVSFSMDLDGLRRDRT